MLFGRTEGWNGRRKRRDFLCRVWMSFGIKCHAVNVKGGEERWCLQGCLLQSCSSLSLFFGSLSRLRPETCSGLLLLPFLKLLYNSFLTATNILPRGQDLPPKYAFKCTSSHSCTRTHTHTHSHPYATPLHPSLSYRHVHTSQLPLYACFKEITEAS